MPYLVPTDFTAINDFCYNVTMKVTKLVSLNKFNAEFSFEPYGGYSWHSTLEDIIKPILKKDKNCLLDWFVNQLENYQPTELVEANYRKLSTPGGYPAHVMKPINSLADLPTINQIIANHVNAYLNTSELEKIFLMSTRVVLTPLLIRTDGIAVVKLWLIESDECVCAPPNHYQPGLTIRTSAGFPDKKLPFCPVCVMQMNNFTLFKGVRERDEVYEAYPENIEWFETKQLINHVDDANAQQERDAVDDANAQQEHNAVDYTLTIWIDAEPYC